ncbi:hypothetical protein [Oceanobacillus chungangensis]|uniref:Uncharacterized protein n=1 Tax=Oceanobacillus chungangensis TaxID=1229152 RepID=A0A3D8PM78_9BACI|nr:hypothetical protein [Oceanobacillus chungangensis]RDW17190.1 hypothetical protein CWR45_12405 [Oceanobacillus chungangensis]
MVKQINGLLYFFITDIRYSLTIFWTILLSCLVAILTISYFLLGTGDTIFYFGISVGIYIFAGISGFLMVKENVPSSLKLGATRKNIFISFGLFFFGLALAKAILANTLQSIIVKFVNVTEIYSINFFHPAQLLGDTWLNRVVIDTSILFFSFSLLFVIGLLFYKYGLLGGGIVVGGLVVVLLLGLAQGWIIDFVVELFTDIELTFFYQLLGVGIVVYCLSFLFLRRITTLKAK